MKTIDLDDPALVLDGSVQPDMRPQNRLPVLYNLWEPMRYVLQGQNVDLPDYFISDLMSVPQAVRTISGLEQDGPHRAADLFHDWAYTNQGLMPGTTLVLTRSQCDDIHQQLCLAGGMDPALCDTIRFFLGLFGGIAWDSHAKGVSEFMLDMHALSLNDLVAYKLSHPNS